MASLERYSLPVKSCSPVFALITGALERSTNIVDSNEPNFMKKNVFLIYW